MRKVCYVMVGMLAAPEVRPDFLDLDIAEDHAMARNLEIRRAFVSLALGFMLDPQAFVRILGELTQQRFESRAAGVLGVLRERRFAQF